MKLGLIVRCDNSGLGNQTWEAFNHLAPFRTMVVDISATKPMHLYPERYAGKGSEIQTVVGAPTIQETLRFLDGLDLVFSCETPYSFQLLRVARKYGVKTIIQPNYELAPWFGNNSLARPDVFGVPSPWHYDKFPKPKILLPVPIATEHFEPNLSTSCKKFLHVVGTPAANDRNGTRDLVDALQYVKSEITVTICSQQKATGSDNYVESMLRGKQLPRNVRLVLDRDMPDNYWQLYGGHDALIMPRRYGGLCMPVNEALGAGMPVIMTDISPNNEWLPKTWLVPAELSFNFALGRFKAAPVDVYRTDPKKLAAKIDEFAQNPELYTKSTEAVRELAQEYSWARLKKLYMDTFDTMMKA